MTQSNSKSPSPRQRTRKEPDVNSRIESISKSLHKGFTDATGIDDLFSTKVTHEQFSHAFSMVTDMSQDSIDLAVNYLADCHQAAEMAATKAKGLFDLRFGKTRYTPHKMLFASAKVATAVVDRITFRRMANIALGVGEIALAFGTIKILKSAVEVQYQKATKSAVGIIETIIG